MTDQWIPVVVRRGVVLKAANGIETRLLTDFTQAAEYGLPEETLNFVREAFEKRKQFLANVRAYDKARLNLPQKDVDEFLEGVFASGEFRHHNNLQYITLAFYFGKDDDSALKLFLDNYDKEECKFTKPELERDVQDWIKWLHQEGKPIFLDKLRLQELGIEIPGHLQYDTYYMDAYDKSLKKTIEEYTNARNLAEQFYQATPFFYDKSGMFWVWNGKFYEMVDDTDILNRIDDALVTSRNTIESKLKNEIMEALKRVGRRHIPNKPPMSLISTESGLYDIDTGAITTPGPHYFFVNHAPWEIGSSEDTPTIDRLFREWVGEKNSIKLLELCAYVLYRSYPIQRIIFLVGEGANGKGSFTRTLEKFTGVQNTNSFDFSKFGTDKFASVKLHGKLWASSSEADFKIMRKTSRIKALCGGDLVDFEYKGKTPFSERNYAKIIISSNSLPMTADRSKGWYRRTLVIDFPNSYKDGKEISDTIPDNEFPNLLRKCLRVLKELLKAGEFSEEGDIANRERIYEEHSNPIALYIEKKYDVDPNGFVETAVFLDGFNRFCDSLQKRHWSPIDIWKVLKELGYDQDREYVGQNRVRGIRGLKKKVWDGRDGWDGNF